MKRILILGAGSDIAKATAAVFAQHGYHLMLAARNTDKIASLKQDLTIRYEVPVEVYPFDARDYASHSAFYDQLSEKPDVAVCVIGYLGDQKLGNSNWQEAHRIIDTNYTGAVSILNVIANDFETRQSGTIVGISSVAGERGRQSNFLYGSAKAAFTTYLGGLRNRLAHAHVHVVTVKPGFVNTKMTAGMDLPGPLTAQPEQVAKAIYNAVKKKKNVIYTLGAWRPIMYVIKTIPEFIFKKLKM